MKTVLTFLVFASIILVTSAGSCEKFSLVEEFYTVAVRNSSNDTIYAYFATGEFSQYPDTSLPVTFQPLQPIAPNHEVPFDSRTPWAEVTGQLERDTLSIFILLDSVYNQVPWSTIRNQNLVSRRFDLSVSDLSEDYNVVTY
jgi:hypothetical protein